jgi:hypothetical protein
LRAEGRPEIKPTFCVQGPASSGEKKKGGNFVYKELTGYKLKILLKGQKFEDVVEIEAESQAVLGSITTRVSQGCLQ